MVSTRTSKPAAPAQSKPASEIVALRGLNYIQDTQSVADRQTFRIAAEYGLLPSTARVVAELAFAGGDR
jgi:hypothetical protein